MQLSPLYLKRVTELRRTIIGRSQSWQWFLRYWNVLYTLSCISNISDNELLSPAQFGFRKHHSTATCILALLDKIYKNMDGNKLTGVVFLDLKKAFDTVDHDILLKKLKIFNVDDNGIPWFKNYLSDRYQSVKVQGHKSDRRLVETGIELSPVRDARCGVLL